MGLPSKKQLHKHKRGTRKALDTLEAMDQSDELVISEPEVEELIKKKKPTPSKTKSKKKSNSTNVKAKKSVTKKKQADGTAADDKKTDNGVSSDDSEKLTSKVEAKTPRKTSSVVDLEKKETSDSSPSLRQNETIPDKIESGQEKKPIESAVEKGAEISLSLDVEKEAPVQQPPVVSKKNEISADLQEKESPQGKIPLMDKTKKETKNIPESIDKKEEKKTSTKSNPIVQEEDILESSYDDDFSEDTQKDKYLSFRIGDETYGISIEYVTEIIIIQRITEVPDTPSFVKGVINLRGKVIPVIDIRHRFGMEPREYDERTCIIVVDYSETAVGMIVDTVNEVVDIPENQVDQSPRTHSGNENTFILGMGKIGKKVTIILDLERVLFVEELLKRQRALYD